MKHASGPSHTGAALTLVRQRGVIVRALFWSLAVLMPLFFGIRPSGFYVITPGNVYEIGPRLRIPAEYRHDMGRIGFTVVYLQLANWADVVSARIGRTAEIVPERMIRPRGISEEEMGQINRRLIDESKPTAAAVALRAAGYDVQVRGRGAEVVQVAPGAPAEGLLDRGTVIVAVDGTPTATVTDVTELVRRRRVGEDVVLSVVRDEEQRDVVVRTGPAPDEPTRPMVGVSLRTRGFAVDLPFAVEIESDNVGGPSAGLMFALAILDAVTEGDLTGGHFVAGTGTINYDGVVGPVGSVGEKVIAAERDGAQVFLVPKTDYAELQNWRGAISIRPVERFQDAIQVLCALARDTQNVGGHPELPEPCRNL